ncbi:uncharacterized protein MONBRDRAFT_12247 [Monosiga brevicollis MX1]|uniref:Tyrosine-protein kinase ephrin type A/B receptor-like domain-containing protein n=1 Tax=Monosiga brevicollis TaxID=81824 RepID=A9VBN8_MONBE|nr:uncharacterized protein MONBRDRAFT_12247 [Monosiga brevicollis MX1]EDQ85010.1 predicted protein [Monosiga brevicollis MX1]|eukprot:XP_001750180.1 hypothetical protein [Monosiga brevicollis MX1]
MRCLAVALGLGLSLGMVDWVAGGAVLDFEFEAPEWFEGEVWESQDPADIRDVLLLNNVSTIGMKQRPLLRSSQNISPDQLDAGVCMSDDSSSSFKAACLPSFLIIGAMKAAGYVMDMTGHCVTACPSGFFRAGTFSTHTPRCAREQDGEPTFAQEAFSYCADACPANTFEDTSRPSPECVVFCPNNQAPTAGVCPAPLPAAIGSRVCRNVLPTGITHQCQFYALKADPTCDMLVGQLTYPSKYTVDALRAMNVTSGALDGFLHLKRIAGAVTVSMTLLPNLNFLASIEYIDSVSPKCCLTP